jgi:PAS domain S-box-containing protein
VVIRRAASFWPSRGALRPKYRGSSARSHAELEFPEEKMSDNVAYARLEHERNQAEERLRATLESITDGFYTLDREWRFTYVNRAMERIAGMRRDRFIGSTIWELFPRAKGTVFYQQFQKTMSEGIPVNFEAFLQQAKRWVEVRAYPSDEGLSVYLTDITPRKQVEEALRESEERYKDLYENANDIIITLDLEGKVTSANRKARQVFGYDEETAKVLDLSNFLTPASRASVASIISRALAEESDLLDEQPWEFEAVTRDCAPLYLEVRARLIWQHTSVVGIQAIARDITERKQAEAQRRKLQTAIDAAIEAVYVLSTDGTIEYVNPAFCRMSGYTAAEIISQNISMLRGGMFRLGAIKKALTEGRAWSGHGLGKKKDGTLLHVDVTVSPVFDAAGTIINYVGVSHDITEEIRLESELRQAHKMEAIGTLAGGIAHDFNNILAAIIGFTEMAIDDARKGTLLKRSMQQVLKAGLRGRDLARQILTFSRKTEYERKPLALAPLVKETVKLLRASLPPTVDIVLDITGESDTILAEPSEIQQVLMNLGTNAAHAMRENGGVMEIRISDVEFIAGVSLPEGIAPGSYVQIAVKDTGAGMAPEVKEKIFEPFFTTNAAGQGTGLGLSVVHQIVKNLKGDITVSSQPGKGSTFTVFLTKAKGEALAEEKIAEPALLGKERILLVEDEEALVEMAKEMLERRGYNVTGATNGAQALEMFSDHPVRFDLVITDQIMPGMTGAELARKLLAIRPDVPIILMTGHNEALSDREAQAAGAMALLMKPFGSEEIARTIRSVLDKKKL